MLSVKVIGNSKQLEQINQCLVDIGYYCSYPIVLPPTEFAMIPDETGEMPILYVMTIWNEDKGEFNPNQHLPAQLVADVIWQE